MCTNGLNAGQFQETITQIDEAVALCRRWTHRAFHGAEDAELVSSAASLKKAQGLLDEVRALLSDAGESLEREAAASGATVKLV
ncbi:MAG: hypothetical protein LBP91_00260 [Coriobacteriales bacterium]|jgi:hypothetical protein|nr:hypothetical protein [Coriobacteriales bacterium]